MKEMVMIRRRRFKMALGAITLGAALQSGGTLVTLCHRTPGKVSIVQTIRVDAKAVPIHLNHGDTLGACPSSPSK
jgi:hypothetical protein